MDLSAEINAQLAKGLSRARVNVQLMYVLIRHVENTGNETSTGLYDRAGCVVSSGLGAESTRDCWVCACLLTC